MFSARALVVVSAKKGQQENPMSYSPALSSPYNPADGEFPSGRHGHATCGEWASEKASAEAFDARAAGWFTIYREVSGHLLHPRPGQRTTGVRIDRILVPTPALLDRGWDLGPVGVELKKSRLKAGPASAQIGDYSRSAWLLDPERRRIQILCDWVFLWPYEPGGGPHGSYFAQHRLGSICGCTPGLTFRSGPFTLVSLSGGRVSFGGGVSAAFGKNVGGSR